MEQPPPARPANLPSEVIDGLLFVGTESEANDAEVIRYLRITDVFSMIGDTANRVAGVRYDYTRVRDVEDEPLQAHVAHFVEFVDRAQKRNPACRVMVYCRAGISRSVAAAMWYLVSRRFQTVDDALSIVRHRRTIAQPNKGFMQQLRHMEQRMYFFGVTKCYSPTSSSSQAASRAALSHEMPSQSHTQARDSEAKHASTESTRQSSLRSSSSDVLKAEAS